MAAQAHVVDQRVVLTVVPEALEHPADAAVPARTARFAHGAAPAAGELPNWWPGNDDPLVYVTFGSVAGGAHLPFFPALYHAVIDALAALPVRILLTIGNDREVAELGELPVNVHAEQWVAHDVATAQAAAVVGHGGYGTTLGTLRHGVPLVVLPLFSVDQWANAAAVAAAGVGIALDGDRATRRSLGLPDPAVIAGLGPAVQRILGDPAYRASAQRMAAAMEAMPPIDTAVDELVAIGARVAA